MRRQRLLRGLNRIQSQIGFHQNPNRIHQAPSPPSLCIFCAFRLLGHDLRPSITRAPVPPTRRNLNTTRPPHQSAAAAAAARAEPTNGDSTEPTPQGSWDPNSALTASEQAERQRRQALQRQRALAEQRERARRLAEEREREAWHQRHLEAEARREREERLAAEHARERAHWESVEARRKAERGRWEVEEKERREGDVSRSLFGGAGGRGGAQGQGQGRQQREVAEMVSRPSFGVSSEGLSRPSRPKAWAADGEEMGEIKPLQYRTEAAPSGVLGLEEEGESIGVESSRQWRPDDEPFGRSHHRGEEKQGQGFHRGQRSNSPFHAENNEYRGTPFNSSSYQPERQRQNNSSHLENEYRTTPFNPTSYRPSRSRSLFTDSHENETNEWQHLRIRYPNSAPPVAQQPQQQTQQQPPPLQQAPQRQRHPETYSDDWIDRQFSQHQARRPRPPQQQQYYNPNIQTAPQPSSDFQTTPPRSQQKCARCLEFGHHARDCRGPVKSTCNLCGQVGHFSRECPQRGPFGGQRGRSAGSLDSRGGRSIEGGNDVVRKRQSSSPWTEEQPVRRMQAGGMRDDDPFGEARTPGRDREVGRTQREESNVRQQNDQGSVAEDWQSDRRARRSNRDIFEDPTAAAEETLDRRQSRRQSRRTMEAPDDEAADDAAALREERSARKAARKAAKKAERTAERFEKGTPVNLPDFISVSNLAQALGVRYETFVSRLEELGYDDLFAGKVLNAETSGMIAMEYNFDPIFEEKGMTEEDDRDLRARPEPEGEDRMFLPARPPVVTIMGHVDHGKTTILDFLRKSSIAAGEAGGITQHIGAFSVPLTSSGGGKTITFLDTPGHAAFLAMRQRGANVTDIVILVVAADDSVKPQTLESIRCAREAGVPMIVAVNKVDKEEADVQRVKQDLARNGVEVEEFGGETQVVAVSGKTGQGMEELEEAVVTLSEILDHRAETVGEVEGWVLEATTKKAGRVATVLVKRGTLRPGAVIVAGKTWARVRTLRNEAGQVVQEVGPGMPVEVDGWRDQPVAGDEVLQAGSEQKAGDVVEFREEREEREKLVGDMEVINEARRIKGEQEKKAREKSAEERGGEGVVGQDVSGGQNQDQEPGQLTVPFIIKADVSGSAEAVSAYIPSLTSPYITPQILHSGVGPVHESDIELASAAQGHIIAFNLPPNLDAKSSAEARGVKVLENNIIYRVLDDVKAVLEEKLPPVVTQRVLGEAEISAAFDIKTGGRKKVVWIAGCKVRNGVVGRGSRVRALRGSEKVYDGIISSLKNVKKDVQEMRKGSECGMGFEDWEGFEIGDQVQTYEEISEKRRL